MLVGGITDETQRDSSQKLFRSDPARMGDYTSIIPKIVDRNI